MFAAVIVAVDLYAGRRLGLPASIVRSVLSLFNPSLSSSFGKADWLGWMLGSEMKCSEEGNGKGAKELGWIGGLFVNCLID